MNISEVGGFKMRVHYGISIALILIKFKKAFEERRELDINQSALQPY